MMNWCLSFILHFYCSIIFFMRFLSQTIVFVPNCDSMQIDIYLLWVLASEKEDSLFSSQRHHAETNLMVEYLLTFLHSMRSWWHNLLGPSLSASYDIAENIPNYTFFNFFSPFFSHFLQQHFVANFHFPCSSDAQQDAAKLFLLFFLPTKV